MELRVENLCYDYNKGTSFEKRALNNINLSIKENEFIGLIGHTGSGKSTLIQTFNGLLAPTEGKVTWNGKDIYEKGFNRREFRSHVGIVFQYPEYQLFETTVLKDVCFGPKNLGISEEESKRKAEEALRLVGLDEKYWQHSPFELSGGQKRRAAIAGVLAMEPEILILDEPTAGLDPKGRDEILGVIKKLNEEKETTIILVSHSMDDVAEYVDRIIVINDGDIMYDDTPVNIFQMVDELEAIDLAAPQITYILRDLNRMGLNVGTGIIRIDDAVQRIKKALSEYKNNMKG
ncbi:MAG: energy-coupling factor transporter ATPase [Lachnospiraceae bacterium]|nr:energy-coupling factor transporter ATPase [Lachnospiraceae bacterium]